MFDKLFKLPAELLKLVQNILKQNVNKGVTGTKSGVKKGFGSIFTWDNWPYFLVVIILIIIIFFVIRRIKKNRAKNLPSAVGEETVETLPAKALISIWKSFLKEIPGELRRSIMLYHPFIVFGGIGTGKSRLIDRYTDWKGQANQFYPSFTADPLLQIYLGPRAYVQEIPASILNDTTREARKALLNLWKPLLKWKRPTVILVIDSATIRTGGAEAIKQQAQIVRGKINLLSGIGRKPVKIKIALTNMNQIEGFSEFSSFLSENAIALNPAFSSYKDIEGCLGKYEDLLTLALTTQSAENYLKLIGFFKNIPGVLSALSGFLKTVQMPDPLSRTPEIETLCFTSADNNDDINVSNPFITPVSSADLASLITIYKHRTFAVAAGVVGCIWILFGFLQERALIKSEIQLLNSFGQQQISFFNNDSYRKFHDFNLEYQNYSDRFIGPFFLKDVVDKYQKQIRRNYVADIRENYLLPEFKNIRKSKNASEKKLFFLSLLYATGQNELGELILDNLLEWSRTIDLPENLIEDYVRNNEPGNHFFDIEPSTYSGFINVAYNPKPWIYFINRVLSASTRSWVDERMLGELINESNLLLADIKNAKQCSLQISAADLLKFEIPGMAQSRSDYGSDIHELQQDSLRDFLLFLNNSLILHEDIRGISISQLMEKIEKMKIPVKENSRIFRFKIADKSYEFDEKEWLGLLNRTNITITLKDFATRNHSWNDGLSFFDKVSSFSDITMNSTNEGKLFFAGKLIVDGRFTLGAYEEKVKPVLAEMPEFIKNLPIDDSEKEAFENYILTEVETYADIYASWFEKYYKQFSIRVKNKGELRLVLSQMQNPSSTFYKFFKTIRENTTLSIEDTRFFDPIKNKLDKFKFISELLKERKEEMPGLELYKGIISQMLTDLESQEPFAPEIEDEPANDLKARLTPLGRFSLSVLRNEKSSYFNLINNWMTNIGIESEWQFLFLDPVYQAYLLGLNEINVTISKEWKELYETEVDNLFSKFPFSKTSTVEVTPTVVEEMLSPQGRFQQRFKRFIQPVLREKNGGFVPMGFVMGSLDYPDNLLPVINEISRLKKLLIGQDGEPKPIVLYFDTIFPEDFGGDKYIATLLFIQSGKSSAFGFYQKKDWQRFEYEWWKSQESSAGVEFTKMNGEKKVSRSISVPDKEWSFLYLLKQASIPEKNILNWIIPSNEMKNGEYSLKISMKEDPWHLLNQMEVVK